MIRARTCDSPADTKRFSNRSYRAAPAAPVAKNMPPACFLYAPALRDAPCFFLLKGPLLLPPAARTFEPVNSHVLLEHAQLAPRCLSPSLLITPKEKETGEKPVSFSFGAPNRARTCDTAVNSRVLYRLCYGGMQKPARVLQDRFSGVGTALSSREAALQVFSARMSLTAVFGMGTGGPSSPLAPTMEKTACTASFVFTGDPYGIRTHVAGVRGQSLRPLDQRAVLVHHQGFEPWTP